MSRSYGSGSLLVIDAEFSREELHLRNEPLLPHFSFNIRCGDSLVQEIGGMNLATLRDAFIGMPSALKGRITRLKNAKLQFFNNDPDCPYRSEKELEQEELRLFRELIDTRAKTSTGKLTICNSKSTVPESDRCGLMAQSKREPIANLSCKQWSGDSRSKR